MSTTTPLHAAAPKITSLSAQLPRGERNLFSTSDDNAMMKQILGTHAHDGREVDVKPLLQIVEDIFHRSPPTATTTTNVVDGIVQHVVAADTHTHIDALVDKTHHLGFAGMLEALAYTIHKISCELSYKCSGGTDAHATALAIFSTLASYSWDAKVVLSLAAFAVNYGEFWLVAQLYPTNPLAKSIALLKQLPDILEHSELLKPRFEGLRNLINAMLDLTKCLIEFKELPTQYIPSTAEAWELSSLAHKINNIKEHFRKQLHFCYQHIDEKRHIEAFQTLVRLFETPHIDNMKILRALIYSKDDMQPIFDGTTKKKVGLEILRRKNVLLLISDLDISRDELSILETVYLESRHQPSRPESQFEMVWLPVLDKSVPWNESSRQTDFERLQSIMPWYSVNHPSLIDQAVIRYIKEVWHFSKKPILVALDPQGRVVCPNAIHMIWIWGSLAFPFTTAKEESLWKEQTWRLDFVVDGIDPTILNWVAEGRYVCLYGGEDLEWIEKFVTAARYVAQEENIPLEFVYVGKSKPRLPLSRIIDFIKAKNLGNYWTERTLIWFFWARLQSMYYSKTQLPSKTTTDNDNKIQQHLPSSKTSESDHVMHEIMNMLSFDSSDQGWAIISRGTAEMSRSKGDQIYSSISQYNDWKVHIPTKGGVIPALNDHLHSHPTEHHCNRLILPGTVGRIPETVPCSECTRPMEKYILYRCCTD
uniref:Protein SIEVE ELEMENT OCCLUSION B-like n=1 Tax=Nelumbo nucifera TaxID=4432 RepID=A0A822YPF0_NELNU|nr:TPA_asm: hypothetical protein HUJ06_005037 [Nelumbo nucifera]